MSINTVSIKRNVLTVNWWDKTEFEDEIEELMDFGAIHVVRTIPEKGYTKPRNIYGDRGGEIIWQIQAFAEFRPDPAESEFDHGSFTGIRSYENDPTVFIANDSYGFRYLIDPETGKIIRLDDWVK